MERRNAEMYISANKHMAFVKHVGKGVFAVCAIVIVALLGCEDRACAAPQRDSGAIETREVIMCDVVVRAYGPPASYRDPRPPSLKMDLKLDPRFHVPGRIEALYVYIVRDSRDLTSNFAKRLEGVEPEPTLYDAPPDMTIYLLPDAYDTTLAIRLDGTTLFGHQVYVDCPHDSIAFNGYPIRQCQISGPITDKASVSIMFFDDDYPPETWRPMVKAVEAGIRGIITVK